MSGNISWHEEQYQKVCTERDAVLAEVERWGDAIEKLLQEFAPDINLDPSGVDSGDPLDGALYQITKALEHLKERK